MNLPFAAIASFSPLLRSSSPGLFSPETVPPTPMPKLEHSTSTSVILDSSTTPLSFLTRQNCNGPTGGFGTVTWYDEPLRTAVGKVNGPSLVGLKRSPPLLARIIPDPLRPEIVPPIVNWRSAQVMTMLSMSRSATLPAPFCTEHACAGVVGCVLTSTR